MPRAARRSPAPGYPKSLTFETREQIDAYLSGDRVTCLLCGGEYRVLDPHLRSAHSMTSDDYREAYGLPYRRGLCGASLRERRQELGRLLYQENGERQSAALAKAKAVQAVNGNPQRNKPTFWKNERTKFALADYEEFMRRVVSGRTLLDVSADDDVPHVVNVYWYMKRNSSFAEKWKETILTIPRPGRKRIAA